MYGYGVNFQRTSMHLNCIALRRAMALNIIRGSLFYQNGSYGANYLRLVYSYSAKEEIVRGMKKLTELLNQMA